jgi:hypothetical protein
VIGFNFIDIYNNPNNPKHIFFYSFQISQKSRKMSAYRDAVQAQQERQLWTENDVLWTENDVRREWERQLKVYVQREATPSTTHRPPIST